MNKYIIKNCPCYFNYENEQHICYDVQVDSECQDCTNCVIKQIVEKCKNIKKDHYWGMRETRFSQEILKLFDIQEIE